MRTNIDLDEKLVNRGLKLSGLRTKKDLVNMAVAAQESGKAVRAEELYAIVLGIDPSNTDALRNLSILYKEAGRSSEAASLNQRATPGVGAITGSR